MAEKSELAVQEELSPDVLMPVGPVQQILRAWEMFQELKRGIIKDDDYYLDERGKRQLKVDGWRKLAIAYGLSSEVLEDTMIPDAKDSREFVARAEVLVSHPRGRKVMSVGFFSSREIRHKFLEDGTAVHPTKKTKAGDDILIPLEHTVYARAETRAYKRAVQHMIGPVEQEDEELEEPEQPAPKAPTPTPPPARAPSGLAPRSSRGGATPIIWDFLDEVLGRELTDLVSVDVHEDEALVKLDQVLCAAHGNAFISRMMKWGYGIHESPAGLVSMIKRPKK